MISTQMCILSKLSSTLTKVMLILPIAMIATLSSANAQSEVHSITSSGVKPPNFPSDAHLQYRAYVLIDRQPTSGTGDVRWVEDDAKKTYSISSTVNAGQTLRNYIEGSIGDRELKPDSYDQKNISGNASMKFDRAAQQINVTSPSSQKFPLSPHVQDPSSVIWQLVGLARANPDKFQPGAKWTFSVAGPNGVSDWTFEVERVAPAEILGNKDVSAVRIRRVSYNEHQAMDVWLAEKFDWFPTRIRVLEAKNKLVDLMVTSLEGEGFDLKGK